MSVPESFNYCLHAKSSEFYWEGTGQLSIKTFHNGRAFYRTNRGFFGVEKGRYLLLNEGDYTIAIEEEKEVESFCLFFKKGLAEEVLRTMQLRTTDLMNDPFKPLQSVGFFEETYSISPSLSAQLDYFRGNVTGKSNPLWQEEMFQTFMEMIVKDQLHSFKKKETLPALKRGTRDELYRRISIAHEYIRAYYLRTITLNELSQVSCLSPNHLLKSYSAVYGCTPHQSVTALRMEKAKQRLKHDDTSITDIALEVGFESSSSFSKAFKQYAGNSPLQFRKKVILDKN